MEQALLQAERRAEQEQVEAESEIISQLQLKLSQLDKATQKEKDKVGTQDNTMWHRKYCQSAQSHCTWMSDMLLCLNICKNSLLPRLCNQCRSTDVNWLALLVCLKTRSIFPLKCPSVLVFENTETTYNWMWPPPNVDSDVHIQFYFTSKCVKQCNT